MIKNVIDLHHVQDYKQTIFVSFFDPWEHKFSLIWSQVTIWGWIVAQLDYVNVWWWVDWGSINENCGVYKREYHVIYEILDHNIILQLINQLSCNLFQKRKYE